MNYYKIISVFFVWCFLYVVAYKFGLTDLQLADIKQIIANHPYLAPVIYLLLFTMRIILFLPSSLFIVAGSFFFSPVSIIIITVIGMIITESIIYYVGTLLSHSKFHLKLVRKYPKLFEAIRDDRSNLLLWIIATPIAPSDLSCFVAALSKMNYKKYIFSVSIGSLPIIILYSSFGTLLAKHPIFTVILGLLLFIVLAITFTKLHIFTKIRALFETQ